MDIKNLSIEELRYDLSRMGVGAYHCNTYSILVCEPLEDHIHFDGTTIFSTMYAIYVSINNIVIIYRTIIYNDLQKSVMPATVFKIDTVIKKLSMEILCEIFDGEREYEKIEVSDNTIIKDLLI